MTFKEKLVRLRKIKGLTQDEFASAVGVSRQAVYKWESGQSYPEVAKLLEIKLLFNISIDDLLDENYVVELPEKKKRKRTVKAEKAAPEEFEVIEAPASVATEEKAEEEQPAPVAVAAQAVVDEPVAEEPIAVAEEPKTEPQAPTEDVAPEEPSKKKVGFFGRIFGRK